VLFSWVDRQSWQPLVTAMPHRVRAPAVVRSLLMNHYAGVQVYHACRPERVESYYEDGLKVLNRESVFAKARDVFLSAEFPDLDEQALSDACSTVSDIDDGRSFVALDHRDFVEYCGHYMIYGSETLCGIAASLGRGTGQDYRQVLKQVGIPTLFRLCLPFAAISDAYLADLVEAIRREIRPVRRGREPARIDFTFRVKGALPAACVLDHSHPTISRDPLLGMSTYTFGGAT
jgi:hypothetical protein